MLFIMNLTDGAGVISKISIRRREIIIISARKQLFEPDNMEHNCTAGPCHESQGKLSLIISFTTLMKS